MSDCFPHFYCNQCSNLVWRQKDQAIMWGSITDEEIDYALRIIRETLPPCSCGGEFTLETGAKCPKCLCDLGRNGTDQQKARDPYAVLITGAEMWTES